MRDFVKEAKIISDYQKYGFKKNNSNAQSGLFIIASFFWGLGFNPCFVAFLLIVLSGINFMIGFYKVEFILKNSIIVKVEKTIYSVKNSEWNYQINL